MHNFPYFASKMFNLGILCASGENATDLYIDTLYRGIDAIYVFALEINPT